MKAIVFLADGFEECEGLIVVDILRRAGIETLTASVMEGLMVDSSRHIKVQADVMAGDVDYESADLIVLPGGRLGTENLSASPLVREQCIRFAQDRYVAAICAAPSLLAGIGLLRGIKATCHPDFENHMAGAVLTGESIVTDGNIITGQGLGASFEFAFELVNLLVGEDKTAQIKDSICYRKE